MVVARAYAAVPRVGQGQRLPRSMEERGREAVRAKVGEEKEGGSDECGTVDSRLKYSARF